MSSEDQAAGGPAGLSQAQEGVFCAVAAFTLWGTSAWFYKLISHVPAFEIIAHRIIWGIPVAAVMLLILGRTSDIRRAFTTPRIILTLILTAALVSLNWVLYVWAVMGGYALEASLGYFINPIVSVLMGLAFLREKLLPAQWVAVGLAIVAVVVQTVLVGTPPWLALCLAATFALYGYLRKTIDIGPAQGFLVETLLFLPVVAVYLVAVHARGEGQFGSDGFTTAWLILAGPMTAGPLILFAAAARRHQSLHRRPAAIHRSVADIPHRDIRVRRTARYRPTGDLYCDLDRARHLFRIRRARRPQAKGEGAPADLRGLRDFLGSLQDGRDDVLRGCGDVDGDLKALADEFFLAHVIHQSDERVPEVFDIGEHNGFPVLIELCPGGHFDGFFECPDTAGKRHKGVRLLEHQHLSLMHVDGDDGVLHVAQHLFPVLQELRDDAGHVPAMLEHGPGDDAHEPQAAAAINQADATLRHLLAEFAGGIRIGRVGARTGAAVYAYFSNRSHEADVALSGGYRQAIPADRVKLLPVANKCMRNICPNAVHSLH